jgi:hypothetical protein
MYDVVHEAYPPSPDEVGARAPGARRRRAARPPAWLSQWVQSYLRACGVHDRAATQFVIDVIAAAPPPDPRSLVIQIHSALARHGVHVAAPSALPALLPAELPGAMPRHELPPVWSTPEQPANISSPGNVGLACGGLLALLMAIFDHGQ